VSQQINLYNPALAPKVDLFSGRAVLLGLAGVLALSLLTGVLTGLQARRVEARAQEQSARLAGLQAEVARLAQQVAARKPDPALQRELDALETFLAARNQVMAMLGGGALGDTRGVSEYFRAFGRQRAEGVWLTGFTIGGGGTEIIIQGRTIDAQLLPDYLSRLRKEDALRGRAFDSLTVAQPPPANAQGKSAAEAGFLEFRMATAAVPAATPHGATR
jgi:hypothetical protein